jgi:hypothetical protein
MPDRSYTLRLYRAALTLVVESRASIPLPEQEWKPYVARCIELLNEVVEFNIIASAAIESLLKMQDVGYHSLLARFH